jgi:phosphatidylserine/phosphatidylglycerophosphate/cardiolipin synthase-like enzyme
MADNDGGFFLDGDPDGYVFEATTGNKVDVFYDTKAYFGSILNDLATADGKDDFIYFSNWWADIYIPLGDPNAKPVPPSLRAILLSVNGGPPPSLMASPVDQERPQICCMLWQHKKQFDSSALPAIVLETSPVTDALATSIFGAPILAAINTEAWKFVNGLQGQNRSILDKAHRAFGSHHQKFIVIRNQDKLVGYVGSSDFNADRLYEKGDRSAHHPTDTAGAPLQDVSIRIEGPAAFLVLRTFVDRWSSHPEGRYFPLIGAGYLPTAISGGSVSAQITHTYGKNYPFKKAVQSAARAQLRIAEKAQKYLYYEDQYLIGTPEIAKVLRDRVTSNVEFVIIGVMAPLPIVTDLPWIAERRSDFWRPLVDLRPDRVLLFEMLNDTGSASGPGAYLHNKMTIADDAVATVGSVNFSRRSWSHDSEIMATLCGPKSTDGNESIALDIRINRWSRHLGRPRTDLARLPDALAIWRRLPSTALVRAWTPLADKMSKSERLAYEHIYDAFFDPA